jgi:hypothetical protein
MNAKHYLTSGVALCMLAVAVAFSACKKDDPEPQVDEVTLTVSADISAEAAAGTYPVTVTCNTAWTAAVNTDATWCTVNPSSGKGDGTITVTVTDNADDTRSAILTVSAGTLSKTVTVTQLGTKPSVIATGNGTDNMPNSAGTATISITANVKWTAALPSAATWCKIEPKAGTNSGVITVTVLANPVDAPERKVVISILGEGAAPATVQVLQVAGEPMALSVTPASLDNLSDAGTITPLNIQTDGAWTASVNSEATWCSIDPSSGNGNGTVTVTVNLNYTEAPRSATITVKTGAATTQQISVTQVKGELPADGLVFITGKTIQALPSTNTTTAPSYPIQFISPGDWSATVEGGASEWLSLNKTSGSEGENTLTVTIHYFTGSTDNTSSIVITSGEKTGTVKVVDSYASRAITHGSDHWSPTDLLDPGKFAPAIGKGKVYQHGRNYGWDLSEGVVPAEFPKNEAGLKEVELNDGTVLPAYPAKTANALPWDNSPCPNGWALPNNGQGRNIPESCTIAEQETIDGLSFRKAGGLHILGKNIEEGGSLNTRAEMWTKEGLGLLNGGAVGFWQSDCYSRTVLKGLWVRCVKEEE